MVIGVEKALYLCFVSSSLAEIASFCFFFPFFPFWAKCVLRSTFLLNFFFYEFTNLVRFNANVVEMHLFLESAMPVNSYDRFNKSRVPDASTEWGKT